MTMSRVQMRALITRYFDGCNEADEAKMTACFVPEAVHYFPDGMPTGPFTGSGVIAARWAEAVANLGSCWTVDNFCGAETAGTAADQSAAVGQGRLRSEGNPDATGSA